MRHVCFTPAENNVVTLQAGRVTKVVRGHCWHLNFPSTGYLTFLCGGILPSERDLYISDLGAYRSRSGRDVPPKVRRIMRVRSIVCLFGVAAAVALKFPLVGGARICGNALSHLHNGGGRGAIAGHLSHRAVLLALAHAGHIVTLTVRMDSQTATYA